MSPAPHPSQKMSVSYIPAFVPNAIPFDRVEDAWFWFIENYEARHLGARLKAGAGRIPRPCEPLDILQIIQRLYQNRRLLADHLKVLRHYGLRFTAPDPHRRLEMRAATLWREALAALEPALRGKGIIH